MNCRPDCPLNAPQFMAARPQIIINVKCRQICKFPGGHSPLEYWYDIISACCASGTSCFGMIPHLRLPFGTRLLLLFLGQLKRTLEFVGLPILDLAFLLAIRHSLARTAQEGNLDGRASAFAADRVGLFATKLTNLQYGCSLTFLARV